MADRHPLVARQMRAHRIDADSPALAPFLDAVSEAYRKHDADHDLVERALDLSSVELLQANSELRAVVQQSAQSVSLLQATLESTADGILVVDAAGKIVSFNQRFIELWGIPADVLARRNDDEALAFVIDQLADPDPFIAKVRELYEAPDAESFDELHFKDGRVFERYSLPQRVDGRSCGRVWSFRDVTARRQAEAALLLSQEQLRQAQKMEAVGRLAGGVAHDFNNILTAIIGYTELLRARVGTSSPHQREVEEILRSARRAAGLTHQLLAFSRQQVLSPRRLDLSHTVGETLEMLRRLIGEDIRLTTRLSEDLGLVLADPVQIGQVILNLAINARDAMPEGGELRIETSNLVLDQPFTRPMDHVPAGEYVLLTVRDSGVGMSAETLQRAFEPFFTTKKQGRGTGLGLATVYGIVKQSGGWIWIESAPAQGTTVRIYFPRVERVEEPRATEHGGAGFGGGTETILLVEDDASVRGLAGDVLSGGGYQLLTAADGAEALHLAGEHGGPIDLLLTDVVMPGLSGRETAERIEQARPGIVTLYMSGYTDDAVLRAGSLAPGAYFIQKPFSPDALLAKIRAVLDQRKLDRAA